MSKFVLILFIAVVASVARLVDTVSIRELQDAKYECIDDINSVLNDIYRSYQSVQLYLNSFARQDIIDTVGPVVRELLAHLAKVRRLEIPQSDLELEIFDNVMERCDAVVEDGEKSVDYVKDFTNLNWGFAISSDDLYDDFGGDGSRPISFDPIRLRPRA